MNEFLEGAYLPGNLPCKAKVTSLLTFLFGFTNAGCLACTSCNPNAPAFRGTKVVEGTPANCLWSSKQAATSLAACWVDKTPCRSPGEFSSAPLSLCLRTSVSLAT